MEDGGVFEVADVALEVLHAPGHSPGSVCLYCEELGAIFTGDVLGPAGPVPHDGMFPDFSRQLSSIGAAVLTLPGQTRVLPGHGRELTVTAAEKRFDSWVAAGPDAVAGPAGRRSPTDPERAGLSEGPGRIGIVEQLGFDGMPQAPVRVHPDAARDLAGLPAPVPDDLSGPALAVQGAALGAQQPGRQRPQRPGGLVAAAAGPSAPSAGRR